MPAFPTKCDRDRENFTANVVALLSINLQCETFSSCFCGTRLSD